mmetsp:Transcript_8799/g.30108  ORF Transcript_8799/g.30108 Transcript_8799/m.30108 type:complete len:285 (-) Transcript_8799:988-1842(-)
MGPAKWCTRKSSSDVRVPSLRRHTDAGPQTSKKGDPPWALLTLAANLAPSDAALPRRHSPSRSRRMPLGRFDRSSMQGVLSGKTVLSQSICSRVYSSSSDLKMMSLKTFWSISFVVLMKTCSKPLLCMSSKPKMSSTPMNCVSLPPETSNAAFARLTSQSKRRLNVALASALRRPVAAATSLSDVTVSPPWISRTRTTRAAASFAASTPRSLAAWAKASSPGATADPSSAASTKVTSPSQATAAATRKMRSRSSARTPSASSAATVAWNSSASSRWATSAQPLE